MTDSPEELSSDLEWMILSGQAEERLLIHTLVREYYPQLYRLNQALLLNSKSAENFALETLTSIMLESHNFSGRGSLNAWIFSYAAVGIKQNHKLLREGGKTNQELTETSTNDVESKVEAQSEVERKLWQIVDRLDLLSQIILMTRSICELKSSDLAYILRQPEWKINDQLEEIIKQLSEELQRNTCGRNDFPEKIKTSIISQSLQKRWSLYDLSESEVVRLSQQLETLLIARRRDRKKKTGIKELLLVTMVSVLVVLGLRTANQLFPDNQYFIGNEATVTAYSDLLHQGKQTDQPRNISEDIWGSQLIPTTDKPILPKPPLTIHSDSETIRERIRMSSMIWSTVWEEGQVIFYGPEDYSGPANARRYQQWVSQDVAGMVMSGPMDGHLDTLSILFNTVDDSGIIVANKLGDQVGREFQWSVLAGRFSELAEITGNNSTQNRLDRKTRFEIVGIERLADREVLAVDQINDIGIRDARLWIDTITGKLLREQQFKGDENQALLREAKILNIYYDIDFTDDLLMQLESTRRFPPLEISNRPVLQPSSWKLPFANIPDIRPVFVKIQAPEKFDPSNRRLVFRWLGRFEADGVYPGVTELYADGIYLGDVEINHPMGVLHCQRSPDGMLIVFKETASGTSLTEPVRWFHLSNPSELHSSLSVTVVRSFSIAPDSRHLAVFGVGTPPPKGFKSTRGIFILDTNTGERVHAIEANVDILFGWSPIGDYLGGLKFHGSRADILSPVSLLAFNVETGDIIEGKILSRDFSMAAGQVIEFEFSELNWRGVVNPRLGGMEPCIHP
jgi:DNA-directed RNA polymerase specialized sigma24 family protein